MCYMLSCRSEGARNTQSHTLAAQSGCVLCRTELNGQSLVRSLPALIHVGLYRLPSVYGFVVEMHSLLHRIVVRCKRGFSAYFVAVDSFRIQGLAEHPEPNTRTYACIRDTRSFAERRRWATILDLETYRDAWLAGAAWAESNSCKSDVAQSASITAEVTIPEYSKRDRLSPQP
jgi:hypothetical protein